MARGCAWQGSVWQGHAWQRGHVCGGMRGRWACVAGERAWQILRDTANAWAVRILLECILVLELVSGGPTDWLGQLRNNTTDRNTQTENTTPFST